MQIIYTYIRQTTLYGYMQIRPMDNKSLHTAVKYNTYLTM